MPKIVLPKNRYFLIDDLDYDLVSQYLWHINASGYVISSHFGRQVRVHRLIMNPPEELEVDHINRDKLDNRRSNLRLVTRNQNAANVKGHGISGFKGVYSYKGGWRSSISKDNRSYYLGVYKTPQKAAEAYNQKALELFGEYAYLNKF